MRFETYGDLLVCYYSSQISKVRRESSVIGPSTSNFQFCTISPNRRVLTPCPLSLLGSRRRLGFWGIWASLLDALHVLFCPPSPPLTCPARILPFLCVPPFICCFPLLADLKHLYLHKMTLLTCAPHAPGP